MSLSKWKACIGLEIHAQISSISKLFSNSPVDKQRIFLPNRGISLFDAGIPGSLPLLNQQAVDQAIRAALSLQCQIHKTCTFERKHYFYQDLPLGYQITQQKHPIASNGSLVYEYNHKGIRSTGKLQIDRIQIEQDSGKSLHETLPNYTLVDLNRAGMALIEIVFAPELETPSQAAGVLKTMQELLRHISVCDGNFEDGSMRCDVNISVSSNTNDNSKSSKRVEIKNLNSIQRLLDASNYEIARQIDILESNQSNDEIIQETRGYDVSTNKTYRMRSKESAVDYRYFPDPDLPPLYIDQTHIDKLAEELPELPLATIERFAQIGISIEKVNLLLSKAGSMKYFDDCLHYLMMNYDHSNSKINSIAQIVFTWVTVEVLGYLNHLQLSFTNSIVSPIILANLIHLLISNQIVNSQAKMILSRLFTNNTKSLNPLDFAKELGFLRDESSNMNHILQICQESVFDKKNEDKLLKYKKKNHNLINYFLGDVLKRSKGSLNPKLVLPVLEDILKNVDNQ